MAQMQPGTGMYAPGAQYPGQYPAPYPGAPAVGVPVGAPGYPPPPPGYGQQQMYAQPTDGVYYGAAPVYNGPPPQGYPPQQQFR